MAKPLLRPIMLAVTLWGVFLPFGWTNELDDRREAVARYAVVEAQLYGGKLTNATQFTDVTPERLARALQEVRNFQRLRAVPLPGLDNALNEIARVHIHRKEFERAEPLLVEVVRDYKASGSATKSMLMLAEVHQKQGKLKEYEEWLRRAAERADERPYSARHAVLHLAYFYGERGEWKKSLDYWMVSKPTADVGCGIYFQSVEAKRARRIANCEAQLQNHAEAARTLWQAIIGESLGGTAHLASDLFSLYEHAGQLDDLMAAAKMDAGSQFEQFKRAIAQGKLTDEEVRDRFLAASPFRKLQAIKALRDREDIQGLLALAQASHWYSADTRTHVEDGDDWQCQAAAEALATLKGKEVEPLRKAILAEQGRSISWLIYALGRSESPEALKVLRELAPRETGYNHNSHNFAFALTLKGASGRKALDEIIVKEKEGVYAEAKQRLDELDRSWPAMRPAPPPKPGSLPKELPARKTPRPDQP